MHNTKHQLGCEEIVSKPLTIERYTFVPVLERLWDLRDCTASQTMTVQYR